MGTISERKTKSGQTRYRAEIRINKQGSKFNESKTFSKRQLANAWLKKREAEIEINPDILLGRKVKSITLSEAIDRYLDEAREFGRTQLQNLRFIQKTPIAKVQLNKLVSSDYTQFAYARLNGLIKGYEPVKPQTVNADLVRIRAVIKTAKYGWGMEVDLSSFEEAMEALRHTRSIKGSDKRKRLPTSDELQKLTNFFYAKYKRRKSAYPMHLIMWFAIYSCRRQGELTSLRLDDYEDGWWLVRDMKNPKGSMGNHKPTKITSSTEAVINYLLSDDIREKMKKPNPNWDPDLLLPLDSRNISASFTRACKMLDIDDLHFHDLRHEGATRLAEQGLNVPDIQRVTGHDSWSSLQIYVNITPRKTVLDYNVALDNAKLAWQDSRY